MHSLLKKKRVVIVGPADSVTGSGLGTEIDSYDLVVRVNHQWPVSGERVSDLGSRMDILFHCCNGDFPIKRLFIPEFKKTRAVCFERGFDSYFLKKECERLQIPFFDVTETYLALQKQIGSYPNTGLAAVTHLLGFDIKELKMIGFSFFKTSYYADYLGATAQPEILRNFQSTGRYWKHELKPQFEYFKSILMQDKRLQVDTFLSHILNGTHG